MTKRYVIKHKDPQKRGYKIVDNFQFNAVYGYKGASTYDAGVIYAPYIPLSVKCATFGIDLDTELDAIKQENENKEIHNKTESFIPPE